MGSETTTLCNKTKIILFDSIVPHQLMYFKSTDLDISNCNNLEETVLNCTIAFLMTYTPFYAFLFKLHNHGLQHENWLYCVVSV